MRFGLEEPQGGLSPRGRGNPPEDIAAMARFRSIPAWAGEPNDCVSRIWPEKVYPRVGGGTMARHTRIIYPEGLSPRGRGNLVPLPPPQCC